MIHSIFGYPEAINVGFRILKRSNKIFGILKYTGYFVRLLLPMNNGLKERMNSSGYSRIRNNAFDLWVSSNEIFGILEYPEYFVRLYCP